MKIKNESFRELYSMDELAWLYATLPDGTTANHSAEDMEQGKFKQARLIFPNGDSLVIVLNITSSS